MILNIFWFLKIAFWLILFLFISRLFGCLALGGLGGPEIQYEAFPLEVCWKGIELRDLKLTHTMRMLLSVIWYSLLFGIFLVIPFHYKKYFERPKFYAVYKKFWLVSSLVFAILWFTLAEFGGKPIIEFFEPKPADFLPVYLTEPIIHISIIALVVWRLAVLPATKQYKNSKIDHDLARVDTRYGFFLKIAFCLILLYLISIFTSGCPFGDNEALVESYAPTLVDCSSGLSGYGLVLSFFKGVIFSFCWHVLLFSIFVMIPLYNEEYIERTESCISYKRLWLFGSLTLAYIGGLRCSEFY